jgi:hypothetical protein
MLHTRTQIRQSHERPLDTGSNMPVLEGSALVYSLENGGGAVKVSTGVDSERFEGFAYSQHQTPRTSNKVEEGVVDPVSYTLKLESAPIGGGGNMVVKATDTNQRLSFVASSSPAAGQYTIETNDTVKGHSSLGGKRILATYHYNMTVQEAMARFGDSPPGSYTVSEVTNTVGCIEKGVIYTDQFSPSDDWASFTGTSVIKAGPNGVITMAADADGAVIPATVDHVPSAELPFLGLRVL